MAVRAWLRTHADGIHHEHPGYNGIEDVRLTAKKPPALIYLDDRAIRFTGPGSFPTVDDIWKAKPWNKNGARN